MTKKSSTTVAKNCGFTDEELLTMRLKQAVYHALRYHVSCLKCGGMFPPESKGGFIVGPRDKMLEPAQLHVYCSECLPTMIADEWYTTELAVFNGRNYLEVLDMKDAIEIYWNSAEGFEKYEGRLERAIKNATKDHPKKDH